MVNRVVSIGVLVCRLGRTVSVALGDLLRACRVRGARRFVTVCPRGDGRVRRSLRGLTVAPRARPGAARRGSSSSRCRRSPRAGTAPTCCRGSARAAPARSGGRWPRPATGGGPRVARAQPCRGCGCGTAPGPPAGGWRSGRRWAAGSCTAPAWFGCRPQHEPRWCGCRGRSRCWSLCCAFLVGFRRSVAWCSYPQCPEPVRNQCAVSSRPSPPRPPPPHKGEGARSERRWPAVSVGVS